MDDEHPCLDELVYLLSKQGNVEIAGAYIDPLVALEASADLKPDASFLDLSMPQLNVAELARKMLAHSPSMKIVFVTAYSKELQKLKENPAVGSILKPVSESKLIELLQRMAVYI